MSDNNYFEAKVWMKSKMGEDDMGMFINEQPEGGFKWDFLDFDPGSDDYSYLFIHNFSIDDARTIGKEIENLQLQNKIMREVLGEIGKDESAFSFGEAKFKRIAREALEKVKELE